MTTRAAPSNVAANRKQKRQKFAAAPTLSLSACFDSLNNDCLVNILTNLPRADMDTVATCSVSCKEARGNDSLDQTRTGTILCTANTTIASFIRTVTDHGWSEKFAGNRTHLRIEGFTWLSHASLTLVNARGNPAILNGVTSLDLSIDPYANARRVKYIPLRTLARMLPNLEAINLSNVETKFGSEEDCLPQFFEHCSDLRVLTWKGGDSNIDWYGINLRNSSNLTELYIDGAHLLSTAKARRRAQRLTRGHHGISLFCLCRNPGLERVSILDVTTDYNIDGPQHLKQTTLIKFVRNTPTLAWLRSDLTDENIAMLQKERPGTTFVSD